MALTVAALRLVKRAVSAREIVPFVLIVLSMAERLMARMRSRLPSGCLVILSCPRGFPIENSVHTQTKNLLYSMTKHSLHRIFAPVNRTGNQTSQVSSTALWPDPKLDTGTNSTSPGPVRQDHPCQRTAPRMRGSALLAGPLPWISAMTEIQAETLCAWKRIDVNVLVFRVTHFCEGESAS
jgi:hypothetical protein